MLARVTLNETSPEKVDESIRFVQETVIPAGKNMKGFNGMLYLVDRKTGKQMAIALWESEADLNASEEAANRLRGQFVQTTTAQEPKVEVYEVAIQPEM